MPIQTGDVKLLKSAVMADVPEGGGAPTGNVITDGASNSIFPDISELDRAGGRVSMRKVFMSIQTDTTDTYFGGNVIVADAPADPRVSVTLFSMGDTFDTRTEASSRVESYLNKGPEWAGYLFENHIQGQRVLQLFQRPDTDLPAIGKTLVLTYNEGLETEIEQYVRATSVSYQERMFYDEQSGKDFPAWIVTVGLSDSLRSDFKGSPAAKSFKRATDSTKTRDTVVADAGSYVGATELASAADLGDFTVQAQSIYTQLVPSAQTETPISDVRTNSVGDILVASGAAITQAITMAWTTTANMHLAVAVLPGSVSIERSGVTIHDEGGQLFSGSTQVGTVDYDNGVFTLLSNVFGTSGGTHQVTFTPASVPELISDQRAIRITPESRSQSYAFVIGDKIARRSVTISYMAQGRWYVLRDNGTGAIKGSESAFGAGTVNYSTGAIVLTLGALPDVGSVLVIQTYSELATQVKSNTELRNGGKAYFAINTDSLQSEGKGSKTITPGALSVTWDLAGVTKTATDNGAGVITGDASGTVDYQNGVIRLSPNVLPPSGTVALANLTGRVPTVASGVTLASGSIASGSIAPNSVNFTVSGTVYYDASFAQVNQRSRQVTLNIRDDGSGNIVINSPSTEAGTVIGTVNYSTGNLTLSGRNSGYSQIYDLAASDATGPTVTSGFGLAWFVSKWDSYTGSKSRMLMIGLNVGFNVAYETGGSAAPSTASVTLTELRMSVPVINDYTLKGVRFGLGAHTYVQLTDGTVMRDPDPLTGGGTPSGTVSEQTGSLVLNYWESGASPSVLNWRGVMSPPSSGTSAPFAVPYTVFRTATSPIRPASLSVLGTLQDGTTFNVTSDSDGKINGTRVKGQIDYEFGLVELFFVNPDGDAGTNVDLSALGIPGLTSMPSDLGMLPTIRYNAVAYSYLPIDADILGLDPVRLPQDGRVPIFRPGGFAVLGHTGSITATVSNGQTINCGRVRLSRVRVVGNDGQVINTGYSANLEAGTVTFSNVTGYIQPVKIEHRIEDMAMVREVLINGEVSFTRALTHAYPVGSVLSSALVCGDLFARVSVQFDQSTWNNIWQNSVNGSPANATFNDTQYPIAVTNRGARTERWAVVFTNTTAFNVIGEHVGIVATGNTSTDCAPLNPATGVPYFTIPAAGWGAGWSTGNVMRFNTVGAEFPVWVVRTIQQGPETVTNDDFTILIRGDIDTP